MESMLALNLRSSYFFQVLGKQARTIMPAHLGLLVCLFFK